MRSVRVLVHLNNLALGGAQLNAVDIARTLRDRGHQPVLFAQGVDGPAPLVDLAAKQDLDLVVAGDPATPNVEIRRRLEELADEHGSQLVHAWEVRAARNAYFGPGRLGRMPVVTTFYGIRMLRGMPRHQPLVLGLGALLPDGRAFGHRDLRLIEPPVNTVQDAPGSVDGAEFRREVGAADGQLLLCIVTRLVDGLEKDAGVERTLHAVRLLDDPNLVLAVVGTGASEPRLRALADRLNGELGRPAIVFTGQRADPRPAYQAADLVLGMGGSALRGLAFGKPVVVHGAAGYTAIHEPGPLVEPHASRCMYGHGDHPPDAKLLAAQIRALADDPDRRAELGRWGRDWVVGRFSLEAVSTAFEELYRELLITPPGRRAWLLDYEQMARYEYTKPAVLRMLGR